MAAEAAAPEAAQSTVVQESEISVVRPRVRLWHGSQGCGWVRSQHLLYRRGVHMDPNRYNQAPIVEISP